DGDLDVYLVTHLGRPNRLFRNDGGVFTDVTTSAGVGDLGWGHMALFLDLDDDGFDDLVVFNDAVPPMVGGSLEVYENLGNGSFLRRTATGLDAVIPIIGGATAADYDHDGDLDLYVTGWLDNSNYLYRNDDDFIFTEVTDAAGLRILETLVPHWTPIFADLDGDGWSDLFGAVDFAEDYLFINQADGTFQHAPIVTSVQNDMGIAIGDYDQDGDLDLLTTNITDTTSPAGCCNWLYQNDGAAGFTNVADTAGVADSAWGWGAWFFDADLDTDLDLVTVNGWIQPGWQGPAQFFLNEGPGVFSEMAARVGADHAGNSHALIPFDADDDGDIDLLILDAWARATFYENETSGTRHWLRVSLSGRASNRNGVGARVLATLPGGPTLLREIVVGGSFYAGPPLEAHFGLGAATSVDLTIQWPSGHVQELLGVAADRRITVVEDGP
ncbi:MAG: CRTAC1 family protein, partial [Planctomycetes bacterium]|nr:CRTAC1 family protein [Planctomycetota bacterium]